ncbi:putative cAMP-dependent protein kinase catalytic subunit [Hypsibius exemplaris]|uniref:cAMP-dependent protein kinase catalytic subunit n=1 Tax=Hypsibius exemplaris TaxID=2072580 RepID=A0A1W0X6D4_HYPEX|nr:putative cAMP-dependent protein kinase catalytic subunit [Hypsibius exemplaris]
MSRESKARLSFVRQTGSPSSTNSKFDHEERIMVGTSKKNFPAEESCILHENRVTFATHIFPDPVDANWVPYIRQCCERFAFRLFNGIIASTKSPYVINKNLKIIKAIPSVTHWEQFIIWNDLDRKVQTLRVARKREISNKFRTQNIVNEKHLMFCCEFPFVLDFDSHFQTTGLLCMLVEELPGGSLQDLVIKSGKIPFRRAQFYASQIVLGLEYLHVMEVILRDLRLKNVVICKDGYVKLVDLGNSVLKFRADQNVVRRLSTGNEESARSTGLSTTGSLAERKVRTGGGLVVVRSAAL